MEMIETPVAKQWATKEDALTALKSVIDAIPNRDWPFYQGGTELYDLRDSDIWGRVAAAIDVPVTVLFRLQEVTGLDFIREVIEFLSTCDLPEVKDYPARIRTDPGPCYPPE